MPLAGSNIRSTGGLVVDQAISTTDVSPAVAAEDGRASTRLSALATRLREAVRPINLLRIAVWVYAISLLAAALLLHLAADRWWLGTVLAFSPRWSLAWPLGVLAPFAAVWRRRLLWPLAASVVLIVSPILGWEMPAVWPPAEGALDVRVLTCNLGGGHIDAWHFPLLVTRYAPDAIVLQECSDELQIDWPRGWTAVRAGQLVVASHYPIAKSFANENAHPPSRWPPTDGLVCRLQTSAGPILLCNVHLRSPREGLATVADRWFGVHPGRRDAVEREIEYRDAQSRDLRSRLDALDAPLIVAGDFNMPPESAIYRRHWGDLINAFSERGWGFGYTKSTAVGLVPYGARIDHVLATPRWAAQGCWLGAEIGSDHVPLIADLSLTH
jgi:endonuclease/exonuclease/phosphatase (EEP) superfamily protein YafD